MSELMREQIEDLRDKLQLKPGSEEWFRAESIQTMNAVYTAGDEETITHNQVIESALRRVWNEGAAQAEAARVEAQKERDQQERFKWFANERVEQQGAEISALRAMVDLFLSEAEKCPTLPLEPIGMSLEEAEAWTDWITMVLKNCGFAALK